MAEGAKKAAGSAKRQQKQQHKASEAAKGITSRTILQNERKLNENKPEMSLDKGRRRALKLQKGSRSSNIRRQKQQKASQAGQYCKMQRRVRKIRGKEQQNYQYKVAGRAKKAAGSLIGGSRGCKKAAEAAT